jgi:hypothetical protein
MSNDEQSVCGLAGGIVADLANNHPAFAIWAVNQERV